MKGHIRPRGKDTWALVIDLGKGPDGKRRQKWHTVHGGKRKAQTELAKILADIDRGAYIEATEQTVGEYLAEWLESRRDELAPKTLERYGELVRLHIAPALGNIPLQKLMPKDVKNLMANARRRDGRPLSPRSRLHVYRVLHVAMHEAHQLELIHRNPVSAVKAPTVPDAPKEYPEVQDLAALLTAAQGHRHAAILSTLIGSGCRIGEVLALRWVCVDFEGGTIVVDGTVQRVAGLGVILKPSPKNKSSFRQIPLPSFSMDALKRHKADQAQERLKAGALWQDRGLVFPDEVGGPLYPGRFQNWFVRLAAKAGVKATPHGCRHAHASLLLAKNTPIADVADRLGHATASVTMAVYAHVLADQRRAAANVIADAFDGVVGKC